MHRLITPDSIDEWATVEQEWQPWHEDRPELRARVIAPDGSVHWLDPKTIRDAPVAQLDSSIFSDARMIRAPLPAVSAGTVVEYEIVKRDTAPFFVSGEVRELTIAPELFLARPI